MKGQQTRSAILDAAVRMARLEGLDALSIGRLAKGVGLSKSGLFAHFNSKETLQLQVLERGVEEFIQAVVRPAIRAPRGKPRLQALFERWLLWASGAGGGAPGADGKAAKRSGGCLFLGAAVELDDQPGRLRDYLVRSQTEWTHTLARAAEIAREEGHLRADSDPAALAFELYGIMMSFHLYHRLLDDPAARDRARQAFERLLAAHS